MANSGSGTATVLNLIQKKTNVHMVSFVPLDFMETWVEKGVVGGKSTIA